MGIQIEFASVEFFGRNKFQDSFQWVKQPSVLWKYLMVKRISKGANIMMKMLPSFVQIVPLSTILSSVWCRQADIQNVCMQMTTEAETLIILFIFAILD